MTGVSTVVLDSRLGDADVSELKEACVVTNIPKL